MFRFHTAFPNFFFQPCFSANGAYPPHFLLQRSRNNRLETLPAAKFYSDTKNPRSRLKLLMKFHETPRTPQETPFCFFLSVSNKSTIQNVEIFKKLSKTKSTISNDDSHSPWPLTKVKDHSRNGPTPKGGWRRFSREAHFNNHQHPIRF